jgi:hypothetical protein
MTKLIGSYPSKIKIIAYLNTDQMKKLIPLILAGFIFSCGTEKQIQMSMTNVQLVRIDTVSRYPSISQQLLTWRSDDHVDYITFEPLGSSYVLGSRMTVMVKR